MTQPNALQVLAEETIGCGDVQREDSYTGLRIASLFIILVTSIFGAAFPVLASRVRFLSVHKQIFEGAKYFGSGVIIATAFIHLLDPAVRKLGSKCLTGAWTEYPWALAMTMGSVFCIFFVELAAFRMGTAKLDALGVKGYESHGHTHNSANGHDSGSSSPTAPNQDKIKDQSDSELGLKEKVSIQSGMSDSALAQLLGVAILEFGVVFHSVLIGMTLAVDEDFIVLFIVLIFHQMFEGLGLGTRLASLNLPKPYQSWVPYAGALLYGLTTPSESPQDSGSARPTTRNQQPVASSLESLIPSRLDLTIHGLVELLAHEFIFNPTMHRAPIGKLLYSCGMMVLGAGIMALIGRWA
ncbi:ZIP-like iron-zinc transporter [Rhizoctonia solani]|nr:ZIP-like iron-zinc transporter [Rhizoctonia solani]